MGVSAFQYLFDFGRTRGLIDQRDAEADVAQARLQLVELDLVFQVTQRYYNLLAAKQIVKVYEKAVAQRSEHLHEAEVKAQAGLKPEIDVLHGEGRAGARASCISVDAHNAAATGKVALDNAMGLGRTCPGLPAGGGADLRGDHRAARDLSAPRVRASAPTCRCCEDEARAAGAQIKRVSSDYLPTVGATAGYSARGQDCHAANNFDVGHPGHLADLQRLPDRSRGGRGEAPPGGDPARHPGPPPAHRSCR